MLIFAGYMSGLTLLTRALGLWRTDLLGSTALWFIAAGTVLFVRFTSVPEQTDLLRQRFKRAVGVAVLLEAFVGLYVFSLQVELVLLPVSAFIAAMAALAEVTE